MMQRRLRIRQLRVQVCRKQLEQHYLYRQLFESAEERLVLCRPLRDDEGETRPSRFLEAVDSVGKLSHLETPDLNEAPRAVACSLASGFVFDGL